MSNNPELSSADALHKAMIPDGRGGVLDRMARAQHAALKEPFCEECEGVGSPPGAGLGIDSEPIECVPCRGTGLNDYARAVLEVGEAAGLGEAKEEG